MIALETILSDEARPGPAFVDYIYGPMMPVEVPPDAPPMFAALALDDPLFDRQGFSIVRSWTEAGRPLSSMPIRAATTHLEWGAPGPLRP